MAVLLHGCESGDRGFVLEPITAFEEYDECPDQEMIDCTLIGETQLYRIRDAIEAYFALGVSWRCEEARDELLG